MALTADFNILETTIEKTHNGKGARVGILRESMGFDAELDSEDFQKIEVVFNRAVGGVLSKSVRLGFGSILR